jgi:putative nucleotidyltransferase with HDIG domain
MTQLETFLQQAEDLPSLPEIYIRVSELLDDEKSTSLQIGESVQTDPSLTTRVLKVVNSAYYGLPNEVTSVAQAVSLLGRDQLRQILLGSVLTVVFSDFVVENFSMHDFWRHSIRTAIIARHLAMQNASILDHEAFFTAGLLHDIGRLVIARADPDSLRLIEQKIENEGRDPVDVERELLGFSRAELGAAILLNWQMPSLLIKCVAGHLNIDHQEPFAVETAIVYLANRLSRFPLALDEDQMQEFLETITNWHQAQCSLDQIYIACQLADEQELGVMETFGMIDMEIGDDDFYSGPF